MNGPVSSSRLSRLSFRPPPHPPDPFFVPVLGDMVLAVQRVSKDEESILILLNNNSTTIIAC